MAKRRTRYNAQQIKDGFGFQQCNHKFVYKSEQSARSAAHTLGLRWYTCEVCTWYHLTSH